MEKGLKVQKELERNDTSAHTVKSLMQPLFKPHRHYLQNGKKRNFLWQKILLQRPQFFQYSIIPIMNIWFDIDGE